MGKYFGTDGYRGEVGNTLNAIDAFKIGEFLGYYYKKNFNNNEFVIGRDTRISGSMLEQAISAGINSTGGVCYILGVTTTPSVSYITREKKFACGIMISASHNPYYDNGIKLINTNGEKMEESVISLIEDYLDGKTTVTYSTKNGVGENIDGANLVEMYNDYLVESTLRINLNVGLDLANGSATRSAVDVFNKLGVDPKVINNTPDGLNINTNCGSTHIEGLQKFVVDNNLDCGFAYDGDADRCLVVDEHGNLLTGDHILYILGNYMKDNNQLKDNTVVTTVMSNIGLYKAFDKENTNYSQTKVGDKYVYECMKENDYKLGGEQSGHIILKDYARTGDGILTSLKLIEVMTKTKKSLSQLAEDLTIYPQELINIRVLDKKTVLSDTDVLNSINEVKEQLKDSGRILVRESGTEPLIRVMVEAESQSLCNELCMKVINVIKNKGYEA